MSARRSELSITFSEDDLRNPIRRTPVRSPIGRIQDEEGLSTKPSDRSLKDLIHENDRLNDLRSRYREQEVQRRRETKDFPDRVLLDSRASKISSRASSVSRKDDRLSMVSIQAALPLLNDPTRRKRHSNREFFNWNSDDEVVDSDKDHSVDLIVHDPRETKPCILCRWARKAEEKERAKILARQGSKPYQPCLQVNRILNSRAGWEEGFLKEYLPQ